MATILARMFGLGPAQVKVRLGDSRLPLSGPSSGGATARSVAGATRRAARAVLEQIFARLAPLLEANPGQLAASGGWIRVRGKPGKELPWSRAVQRMGAGLIRARGTQPAADGPASADVGGVQMAEVQVDMETGLVRLRKMVAVQDCGHVVDRQRAESQVQGGLVMGISTTLCEERILDPITGRPLNTGMDFYRLAGPGDVGELVVHLMAGERYHRQGILGLGEPPVISPAAAISNAVANAVGIRVPGLPLTPGRVVGALEQGEPA